MGNFNDKTKTTDKGGHLKKGILLSMAAIFVILVGVMIYIIANLPKREVSTIPDTTLNTTSTFKNATELPRLETLYFSGIQWGFVKGWNPFSSDMNNSLAIAQLASGSRETMFETPYMYNMIDNSLIPLLADGDYEWNADRTELIYKIKPAAKWSDGTPILSDDAAFTWMSLINYSPSRGAEWTPYISDVFAQDKYTVVIKCVVDNGKPVNTLMVLQYIEQEYILQKAWLQKLIDRNGSDVAKIAEDPADDVVWSGPYTKYFADDAKVVMIRDNNYWGKDPSMWGKLPEPKYLAHYIYADNNAGQIALAAGQVDVCSQFITNVQDLWLKYKLPISTYMNTAPYNLSTNMPTAFYNMSSYGLDNPTIRRAIAMAVDYDMINEYAMTNQSPTFLEVPRSLMSPTKVEQAMYDRVAISDLQWTGNNIEGAKRLLDVAGIVDTDGDGWREYNGKKLKYNAVCPDGWSDWQVSMEIVSNAGKNIGIDISTLFPEANDYITT